MTKEKAAKSLKGAVVSCTKEDGSDDAKDELDDLLQGACS